LTLIVFDTDFLIKTTTEPLPEVAEFLGNSEYELVTLTKIESELKGLVLSEDQKTARKARAALRTLSDGKVKVLRYPVKPSSRNTDADALLIDFAANSHDQAVIATMDRSILAILERRRMPYLTLRKDRPFFRSFESATYLLDKRP
jgi:rRNA-processing protein FCF1